AHYRLAFLYRTRRDGAGFPDPVQALEHARLAVEHAAPANPAYYELLAVCYRELGELDPAIEALSEAVRLSQEPRYAKRLQAYLYDRDGPPPAVEEPMPGETIPEDEEELPTTG